MRPAWLSQMDENRWRLLVRVQPGARKSEAVGEAEGRLRIRIAAPAVDNKANEAVVRFVAKQLHLRPNRVSLVAGLTSREKTLMVISECEPCWEALCPQRLP